MEAANRGSFDVGAKSVGLNISLPHEQYPNPYVTPELCFSFHYFALRKLHFLLRAKALVAFPGGYGTFDEVFEILTLVQTRKIKPIPVVLVGESYWRRAVDLDFLVDEGVIDLESLGSRCAAGAWCGEPGMELVVVEPTRWWPVEGERRVGGVFVRDEALKRFRRDHAPHRVVGGEQTGPGGAVVVEVGDGRVRDLLGRHGEGPSVRVAPLLAQCGVPVRGRMGWAGHVRSSRWWCGRRWPRSCAGTRSRRWVRRSAPSTPPTGRRCRPGGPWFARGLPAGDPWNDRPQLSGH